MLIAVIVLLWLVLAGVVTVSLARTAGQSQPFRVEERVGRGRDLAAR